MSAPVDRDEIRAKTDHKLGFFGLRWHGFVPLKTLFWRDMVLIGSALNIATTVASLLALGFKAPLWVALVMFFSPTPYNIFLCFSVWRTAGMSGGAFASTAKMGAAAWLVLVLLL
ncbi:hypothetical protein ABFT80_18780 [Mesorhizobium sp. SB112]|uniref:hypothetical protein n=1 Tax=Mesorhizobium sp. SB112 TaxID=3151853 RepID=UPI0032635860